MSKCKNWWNGLSAEGAKADARSALHSADNPPFLCYCPFLVSMFAVGLCVLWVLCGPSKATARCYTSICDSIILLTLDSLKSHQTWKIVLSNNVHFRDEEKYLAFFTGFIAEPSGQLKSKAKLSELDTLNMASAVMKNGNQLHQLNMQCNAEIRVKVRNWIVQIYVA
jgi:hypothetical protein